jgi:transposase
MEALKARLAAQEQRAAQAEQRLSIAELKIQLLEQKLRKKLIEKYGPRSESLSSLQLELLELEPGVSSEEVAAESESKPPPRNKPRKPHPGRQQLPSELPRVERVIACAPEQCICPACGRETEVIGYDRSEMLDVQPAKYFVQVTKREKRACKHCVDAGVSAAPLPERIVDKGLLSDRVVIDIVVKKYTGHLPLYRQSAMLEREAGIGISLATMDGYVMRVGELLVLLADAMRRELLGGSYIQADETPIAVQMHDGSGANHQAYLWQYGTPGGGVVYDFRMGRGRDGPRLWLDKYDGILQTDGYSAYEMVGGNGLVHACCWSHSRRKFADALKLSPGDKMAEHLLRRINQLFAVDAAARDRGLDVAGRHALRLNETAPVLDTLRDELKSAVHNSLPSSAVAKGANYTLSLWDKLTRFLEHPIIELSNNVAENSMRPVALGRKNWLHLGSKTAGPKVAAILSVIESCRRLKLNPYDYLAKIMPSLANQPISQLAALTPLAVVTMPK